MSGFPRFVLPKDPCNLPVVRCRSRQDKAERRILIQRNGAHGDILMATPILTALRQSYPEAHLTWVVEHREAPTMDTNPYIDELLVWDTAYWKRLLRTANYPTYLLQAARLRRQLRLREYDIFISYQPEEWAYLLTQACGAPVRIGVFDTYSEFYGKSETSRNTRHFTRSFTQKEHPPHRTDQYLLPLEPLGLAPRSKRMLMGYTEIDRTAAERWLVEQGVRPDRFVAIAPLTTWPSRCWEAAKFAGLAEALRSDGYSVVFIGSASENAAVTEVAEMVGRGALTAAGNFSFRELAAFLDRAALVVSGDTGPMHLAAALETPFLSLFGPTPPARFAPLHGPGLPLYHPVPCSPCYKKECPLTGDDHMRCLRPISVQEAVEAARQLLSIPRTPREADRA